ELDAIADREAELAVEPIVDPYRARRRNAVRTRVRREEGVGDAKLAAQRISGGHDAYGGERIALAAYGHAREAHRAHDAQSAPRCFRLDFPRNGPVAHDHEIRAEQLVRLPAERLVHAIGE